MLTPETAILLVVIIGLIIFAIVATKYYVNKQLNEQMLEHERQMSEEKKRTREVEDKL